MDAHTASSLWHKVIRLGVVLTLCGMAFLPVAGRASMLADIASPGLPADRFLFAIVGMGVPEVGKLLAPNDVAVGPDGTVYVLDSANWRIQYFSADGEFRGTWGTHGATAGRFYSPRAIAAAPDGSVYVADQRLPMQRFAATGAFLGACAWSSGGNGLAVGSDGSVYVTTGYGVDHYSASGALLHQWGTQGSGNGQFAYSGASPWRTTVRCMWWIETITASSDSPPMARSWMRGADKALTAGSSDGHLTWLSPPMARSM